MYKVAVLPTGEFEVFVAPELLRTSRDLLDSGQAISCARDRDKTIKLWDLDTGTLLGTFKGHKRYVRRLCPLPGSRFLSIDRTIRLWDQYAGTAISPSCSTPWTPS